MDKHKFDTVWLVEPTKDFSALSEYCDKVRFISSGVELIVDLPPIIEKNLREFNPHVDAIVAVGRSNAVLIAGIKLHEIFPDTPVWFGIYQNKVSNSGGKKYVWVIYR